MEEIQIYLTMNLLLLLTIYNNTIVLLPLNTKKHKKVQSYLEENYKTRLFYQFFKCDYIR